MNRKNRLKENQHVQHSLLFRFIFSLSNSTLSISSCSSKGSLSTGSRGSLSSSRGSLSSLSYLETGLLNTSEQPNLRELHQRVTDMLHVFQPPVRTSGIPTSYTSTSSPHRPNTSTCSPQMSFSSRDSLSVSSLSPPMSPSASEQSPVASPVRMCVSQAETTAGLECTDTERSNVTQVSVEFSFTCSPRYESYSHNISLSCCVCVCRGVATIPYLPE